MRDAPLQVSIKLHICWSPTTLCRYLHGKLGYTFKQVGTSLHVEWPGCVLFSFIFLRQLEARAKERRDDLRYAYVKRVVNQVVLGKALRPSESDN